MFETTWISAILRNFFGRFDGLELWAGRCFDQKKKLETYLGVGWTTHLKTYICQIGSFLQGLGWKQNNIFELPPPRKTKEVKKMRKHTGLSSVDLEVKPSPASPFKVCCSHDVFSVHRSAGCRGCHSWPAGFFSSQLGGKAGKIREKNHHGASEPHPFNGISINFSSKHFQVLWPSYLSTWCPFRDHQLGVPIVNTI